MYQRTRSSRPWANFRLMGSLALTTLLISACAQGALNAATPEAAGQIAAGVETPTAHPTLTPIPAHPTPAGPVTHATPVAGPDRAASTCDPAAVTRAARPGEPWPMFHKDEQHTGVAIGTGDIDPSAGPAVRWTYPVTDPPTEADFLSYRWYSSFPLGDLDGDGTLEVIVTTADNSGERDRVIALKDMPGQDPPVCALWTFDSPDPPGMWRGFDQYSAALADADSDGLLDVFFTSKNGFVRALRGTTGEVLWEFDTDHFIEAGPMVTDLEDDGAQEIIVATDCSPGPECVQQGAQGGALYVFAANPQGGSPVLWSLEFPYKLDSAEPALGDLDPNDRSPKKAMVFGSWGGFLHVLWRNPDGTIVSDEFDIRRLEPGGHGLPNAVIRSSPLLADFGDGPTAIFGWMPDWTIGTEARISAVRLSADMRGGQVTFTPLWSIDRDDWKSSVALLPVRVDAPLVVTGYGIGTTVGTGNYGACEPPMGGIIAIDPRTGKIVWENVYQDEGNVRGSSAVADIDSDGQLEVLLTVGCFGKLYAYDGATGREEWGFQLGPRTIGTPSVGDLDGDGYLEIVVPSYDGRVWVLGGAP